MESTVLESGKSSPGKVTPALALALRLALSVVVMTVVFVVSASLSGADSIKLSDQEAAQSGFALLVVASTTALLLTILALRSRLNGWRLASYLFLVQFGIETFMTQGEALVFNNAIGYTFDQFLPIFLSGFLRALLYAPLCVFISGKAKRKAGEADTILPGNASFPRLAVLAFFYVAVYFLFGYFVAWQWEETRVFYTGKPELLPFFTHMAMVFRDDFRLVLIQVARGFLWALIALRIVRSGKGGAKEASATVGTAFSLLVSIYLAFPNPFMPVAVRMSHAIELGSSMLLYGAISGWLLSLPKGQRAKVGFTRASR